jgi:bisphosphoglycerate-dependent phosphoglycerate mutase
VDPVGELVVVRHGQTEWSRDGKHTGVTDLPLLPAGEDDARRLRSVLAERGMRRGGLGLKTLPSLGRSLVADNRKL